MKKEQEEKIRITLLLDYSFYELLREKAKNDYMKIATWIKQYLMKSILGKNNSDIKILTKDGKEME